jgi:type II restriction/modification system DNA methylase subunit YeeA
MLDELLAIAQQDAASFSDAASLLFRAMKDPGGRVGFRPVPWFNGGLFDDDTALPLLAEDIALLNRAAANDWSQVDPSIFGTLFERGVDPNKRSQLGAFYTDREKIELLVGAVVTKPFTSEWETIKATIEAKMDERAAVLKAFPEAADAALALTTANAVTPETQSARKHMKQASERRNRKLSALLADADALYRRFLTKLRAFRILDPACGSGNFLYVSMLDLKNLEHRVSVDAENMGLEPSFPTIGPEAVLGIELNPYAAEMARVSVWIGHIQWARRHGYPPPSNPVLRNLDTIECRDALIGSDGQKASWPVADVIVGNPPFIGDKQMIRELGEEYTRTVRELYKGAASGQSDLVCFWFAKAKDCMDGGHLQRVGFVSTNSIRTGKNRGILEKINGSYSIYAAWSDEPWINEGASVRVSITCFTKEQPLLPCTLNGIEVEGIFPNLQPRRDDHDVSITSSAKLICNKGFTRTGVFINGPFGISEATAVDMLLAPENLNGRGNSDVIKKLMNGDDIMGRSEVRWIIDFGSYMSQREAAFYEAPFKHVAERVKPYRERKDDDGNYVVRRLNHREKWWQYAESRPGLRAALIDLPRYLVTPMVSKHRVFTWLDARILPDQKLVVFPTHRDSVFGILQSRFHELWTLATCSWIGVGNDPTYTATSVFDTFPFAEGINPKEIVPDAVESSHAQAVADAARQLVERI